MDIETWHLTRGWPEIPEDPEEVLTMLSNNELVLDQDMLIYLWARSHRGEFEEPTP